MNVIWVTSDSFRKDHIGAYGNPQIRTPSLDMLAAKSIRFRRHYAAGFPTMPTRAAWRFESEYNAPQTFTKAMQWLEHHYREDFFLYIDTWYPHEPWGAPAYFTDIYRPDYDGEIIEPIYGCWKDVPGLTQDRLDKAHATYCGEITMVDTWLGYLLRQIDDAAVNGREFTVSSIPFANPGDPVRSVDNFLRMLKAPTVTTITSANYSLLFSPQQGQSKLYDLALDPGQQTNIFTRNKSSVLKPIF